MKNLVKTDFDKLYEELSTLNEEKNIMPIAQSLALLKNSVPEPLDPSITFDELRQLPPDSPKWVSVKAIAEAIPYSGA